MASSHRFIRLLRRIHLYLGVFTAPALVFFAITGGAQTFGLHERSHNSRYTPPAWLVTLTQLHRKQITTAPPHRAPADATAAHDRREPQVEPVVIADNGKPAAIMAPVNHPLPLKIFFGLVSLGLLVSVLSGLYMAYVYTRRPGRITLILLAGVLVPWLLIAV